MSNTAQKLGARIDEQFARGDMSPIMRAEMLDIALARIDQLERGIALAEDKLSLFDDDGNRLVLLKLIEELSDA